MAPVKKHSVEEIVTTLRDMERLTDEEGMSVSAAALELGITDQTFYRWRARYGSLPEDEAKRLQVLDEENARLKRIITEQSEDISLLQDLTHKGIPSAAGRRDAVAYLVQQYQISERRACRLVGQHRSTQRYATPGRLEERVFSTPSVRPSDAGGPWSGTEDGDGVPTAPTAWLVEGWTSGVRELRRHSDEGEASELDSESALGGAPAEEFDGGNGDGGVATPGPSDDHGPSGRFPSFGRLRAGLAHDLLWLARDSELARLVGARAVVQRVEELACPPQRLVRFVRGHSGTTDG